MDKFFLDKILEFVFPPRCGFCGEVTKNKQYVCEDCSYLSTQKYTNRCHFCGKISNESKCFECRNKAIYYEKLIFCSEYTKEFKDKIHLYKFQDKKFYYHFFTEMLYNRVKDEEFDLIIPVPISKERLRERGYNQAGLIANKIGHFTNKPCDEGILVKVVDSKRQSMQNFKDRQESVKKVFKIADILKVKGKNVLLIDDIFTTGATANECSRVLKEAGAKNINVAVICISHTLK